MGMFKFKEKKQPRHIENAWGRELIDEGMKCFVGDYEWLPEYDGLVSWLADNKNKGLLCVGDFGRGKSLFCENILTAMFDAWGWRYISVSAYEIARKVDEIKTHDVVIIDDIGVEGEAVIYGEHRYIFNEIVDYAEKNGVLLILTSNLSNDELTRKYGIRTVDRMRKITEAIVFQGKSLR